MTLFNANEILVYSCTCTSIAHNDYYFEKMKNKLHLIQIAIKDEDNDFFLNIK